MRDRERDSSSEGRKDIFDICRGGLKGELGACHPCLICLFVHTNHWIAATVRKACVLCDKLTSGKKNRQKEEMEKESMAGGWGSVIEHGLNIGLDPYWALSCPKKTPHQRCPFPGSPMINSIEKYPSFFREQPWWYKIKKYKIGSKCTPKQISKCGAQWPQRRDHPHGVCGVLHHPHLLLLCLHGCISQAQMGFSAMRSRAWHALNNGKQMTGQLYLMMASADTDAFFFWSGGI